MTQFGGSLRFVQLPAVAQLLSELHSTGRLSVSYGEWTGDIIVREGQMVEARLGDERGRAALESIAVALPDGDFNFVDERVADTSEALVAADERVAYLERLGAEHQRLVRLIPSLDLVPRLVDASNGESADTQVTIGAAALQLIPALVLGHTLGQVARQRGLARTVREVAVLMQGGVVELAPAPTHAAVVERAPAVSVAPHEPVVEKPAPAPVQPFSARLTARRIAPRQRTDALPAPAAATVTNLAPRPISTAPRPVSTPAPPVSARPWPFSAPSRPVSSPSEQTITAPQPVSIAPQPLRIAPQSVTTAPRPSSIAPRPSDTPTRPAMPPAVAARLADATHLVLQPASQARSIVPRLTPNVAAWRSAIVGFFLRDEPPAADAPSRRAKSSG